MYDLNTSHLNLPNDVGIDVWLLDEYIFTMVRHILFEAREKGLYKASNDEIHKLSLKARDNALHTFNDSINKGENENIITIIKCWTVGETFMIEDTDIKISIVLMYDLSEDTRNMGGWSIICRGYLINGENILDKDGTLRRCVDKHQYSFNRIFND